MNELDFCKMHGLGNDFVIVDLRSGRLSLSAAQIRRIGDRQRGVGFDQLLCLEPSSAGDVFMRVFNPDGREAEACGNGTRCVARLMMEQLSVSWVRIETVAGILKVKAELRGFTVNMGKPGLGWDEIPLAGPADTLHLDLSNGDLSNGDLSNRDLFDGTLADPVAVGMGNPHAVFFVDDADAVPLEEIGPRLQRHPMFPKSVNVGVATVRDHETIRLRVYERGAGLTLACGSGACACLVAAVRRNLAARAATVHLDGGPLRISWTKDDEVLMTGPASHSFQGRFDPEMLAVQEK